MIPKSHPRYASLKTRELIENGVKNGITSLNGLIAHGRGEAFDYLLGEKTHGFAKDAIKVASVMLLLAKCPVISVNGNTAALAPDELVRLAELLNAPLEINLFHTSKERIRKIQKHLQMHGAKRILLPDTNCVIPHLASSRKYVNPDGIYKADVVFVALEDGDRTEALIKNGKRVITVDLNPLSRTAQRATITIVDNIVRTLPLLIKQVEQMKKQDRKSLLKVIHDYYNKQILARSLQSVRKNLG